MSAISQKVGPEDVLPLLARNVMLLGYSPSRIGAGKPTEYLVLLKRYLEEAAELQRLAGSEGVIRVANCGDAEPLLQIIGYRLVNGCGRNGYLATAEPDRAFVTIDSGFPLSDLEADLRSGKTFTYPFEESHVPVLLGEDTWKAYGKPHRQADSGDSVVDTLVDDPLLARLYWAFSNMDPETILALKQSAGLDKLVPCAAVLDFYGSNISIRSGHVEVPGGPSAEAAWKELVGASPDSPGDFVIHLISRDRGWLAAFYDAISRGNQAQQAYFTGAGRIQRFYQALRGQSSSGSAFASVYRPDAEIVLLVTQLQLDSSGQPVLPGGLDAWRDILRTNGESDPQLIGDWARRSNHWSNAENAEEAMFALSRIGMMYDPAHIYLALSEIDRVRAPGQRMSAATARLLAAKFSRFSDQYLIFTEFPALIDTSIADFLRAAEGLDRITDATVRGNAFGIFQANVGLWQILARQGQIAPANLNESWEQVIHPFVGILSSQQLYDAGEASLSALLHEATGKSEFSEDEIVALLSGPDQSTEEGQRVRREIADRMRSILVEQRLVSLDTILSLGNGLTEMAQGKGTAAALLPLAAQLREFEMPQQILTTSEKYEYSAGLYDTRHTRLQMRTDLAAIIKAPGSPQELTAARGLLTPFLRDTLVGLNYAYYEPPGAEILHSDPLFVRSHDFIGDVDNQGVPTWQSPILMGRGWAAAGGAHLAGSLAALPYALANAEQNFIVPENVQALIWEDLVPDLVASAVLPRWWNLTPNELHAVALYQRTGEELIESASRNEETRQRVMGILADCMLSRRSERVGSELRQGHTNDVLDEVTPAETFYLAATYRQRFPDETNWGPAGRELADLVARDPAETSWERLSVDFGEPHPALAQSYARDLLNVKLLPTFQSYSSRLMAESWESDNLYWARLADELGYSPVALNRLVPELTRHMVEKIFATDYEDWPAVLRAMRETGKEFREGKIVPLPRNVAASGL